MDSLKELKQSFNANGIEKADFIDRMYQLHRRLFEYPSLLNDSEINKITISRDGVYCTWRDGIELICDPFDRRGAGIERINFSQVETEEAEMMLKLFAGAKVIFDVGANVGCYTMLFVKNLPGCAVHSFEPVPDTFAYLQKHAKHNHIDANLYNFGLSDQNGRTDIFFDPENTGASSLSKVEGNLVRKVSCEFKRLDDFVADVRCIPDGIKCDVEGAELLVMNGAVETLKKSRPILFLEMLRKWSAKFSYHPNDIIEYLGNLDYSCFTIANGGLKACQEVTEQTIETNYFFLHRVSHRQQIEQFLQQ